MFAVETFFLNSKSINASWKTFRAYFMLDRNDAVPNRIAVLIFYPEQYHSDVTRNGPENLSV